MHKRAEWSAHLQHTGSQDHLGDPMGRMAKPQHRRGLIARFDHACVQTNLAGDLALVDCDDPLLAEVERDIEKTAHRHDPVSLALLRTLPGVGKILALVMLYEIEEIARFPRVQEFVSYSLLVKSAREAHGTRHATRGKKIGNAPLTWACSETAGLVLKHHEPAQTYLATRATPHGQGKALSILAHTRGRAVYCMLKHRVACDQAKFLVPEGWRERTNLASHGSHRGKRHTPFASNRAIMLVAMSPYQRCVCRMVRPASSGVAWQSVPLLDL
jgi:Transposase IS116/IS110/IS902 family